MTFFLTLILMMKLSINRRLTLPYSLLIPIVYTVIRKGSFFKSLFYSLSKICKLPCFALWLPFTFLRTFLLISSCFFGSLFYSYTVSYLFLCFGLCLCRLELSRSRYIRAILIILKKFTNFFRKPLTIKILGAIIRVQQHMDS